MSKCWGRSLSLICKRGLRCASVKPAVAPMDQQRRSIRKVPDAPECGLLTEIGQSDSGCGMSFRCLHFPSHQRLSHIDAHFNWLSRGGAVRPGEPRRPHRRTHEKFTLPNRRFYSVRGACPVCMSLYSVRKSIGCHQLENLEHGKAEDQNIPDLQARTLGCMTERIESPPSRSSIGL